MAAAVAAALVVVLGALIAVVRVPFIELGPGPVCNTVGAPSANCPSQYGGGLIRITPAALAHRRGDQLYLTTVSVQTDVTALTAVQAWFSHATAVIPRDVLFNPGQSTRQADRQQLQQMAQSQNSATVAALAQLGHVLVTGVRSGYPAAGRLRAGEEILAVNGHPVHTPTGLVAVLSALRPGSTVQLIVSGAGPTRQVSFAAASSGGSRAHAVLGITVTDRPLAGVKVGIGLEGIGGPSAGLMLALGIIDELSPTSLTGGLRIAGTGTIDDQGNVGPIGGIQQKMYAARHFRHAQVFLAPVGDCGEARQAIPAGLRVVAVSSLSDALHLLGQLRAGRTNLPTC